VRTDRVRTTSKQVCKKMDAYESLGCNSLIPFRNSLLFKIFSLLICVGNFTRSRCGTAVYRYRIGPGVVEIAKFPVKFPVSREFLRRRVRSALRRQPGSHSARDCWPKNPISARQLRPFVIGFRLYTPNSNNLGAKSPIVSSLTFEIFPFFGDASQRRGAISTAWRTRQCKSGYSSSGAVSAMAGITPPFGAMRSAGARSTAPHKERDLWQENWKARLPS
jgi:hypothetical protein